MNLTTWTLVALLIAVVGCLVNIVILIRRVNRLKSMALRQISINANLNSWQASQETKLDEIELRTGHMDNLVDSIASFASKENDAMDDVAILFSGMKANCFGKKAGTDKKFAESLHRINKRVRDLNKD